MKTVTKFCIVTLVMLVSGCAVTQAPVAETVPVESSLFDDAHRCQGIVKYQAEVSGDQFRSRLSCEWTVNTNEWGVWQ